MRARGSLDGCPDGCCNAQRTPGPDSQLSHATFARSNRNACRSSRWMRQMRSIRDTAEYGLRMRAFAGACRKGEAGVRACADARRRMVRREVVTRRRTPASATAMRDSRATLPSMVRCDDASTRLQREQPRASHPGESRHPATFRSVFFADRRRQEAVDPGLRRDEKCRVAHTARTHSPRHPPSMRDQKSAMRKTLFVKQRNISLHDTRMRVNARRHRPKRRCDAGFPAPRALQIAIARQSRQEIPDTRKNALQSFAKMCLGGSSAIVYTA